MIDVLIPTRDRPSALALTLLSLDAQTRPDLRIVVSDQSDEPAEHASGELRAVLRVLALHDRRVEVLRHLPRRGMAEQRQFLLDQARNRFALFLDDDVIVEPDLVERLLVVIQRERCGFVGSPLVGLSYDEDVRPHEQAIEWWDGPVRPERVRPNDPAWARARLHPAATALPGARDPGLRPDDARVYRVAWVGGCVLYDVDALRAVGGFEFWRDLPDEHAGEDVLAQLRVMERFGGCGILPSGAYHQELPTTIPNRPVDAPLVLA